MSSLLKKNPGEMAAAFGFPVIPSDSGCAMTVSAGLEEQLPEPEIKPEELYRKKLLEIERRTQEIERDAYGKGFAQGEKDGIDYGQKSVEVVKSQIERIAQNMEALPAKVLQDYRDWLIRASISIARQIVNREIQTSPEIVAEVVKGLVEGAEEHSTLTVYLNPNDLEIFEKRAGLTPQAYGKRFTLKADRDLERGGCRVESAIQLIDASLAGVFENLEKELLDEARGTKDGGLKSRAGGREAGEATPSSGLHSLSAASKIQAGETEGDKLCPQ